MARTLHFIAVSLTFLAIPFLFVTGFRLARREDPGRRAAHRKSAIVFLFLVLVTFGLGSTMTALADTIEDDAAASRGITKGVGAEHGVVVLSKGADRDNADAQASPGHAQDCFARIELHSIWHQSFW